MQKIIRNITISALFLIPLFALFPTPFWPLNFPDSLFFPFITGKAFYFRILVEVALAGWAILAFLDPRYRPKWTAITITVSIFAVVTLLADLLGVNPIRSLVSNFERMEGWLVVVHLWAFYMVSTHVFGAEGEGRKLWHRWFIVSLSVASVTIIYALTQLFGWTAIHQGSSRLDASLGNAAYMAVYMLMNLGISAYLFFRLKRGFALQIAATICIALAIILFSIPMFSMVAQSIIGLVLLVAAAIMSPYLTFSLVSAFIILETQTRGTIIGLAVGVITTCVSYALFANGINYKKILVALSYPLILALYALFVLILESFSMSLWYMYWIAVAYIVALIIYIAMSSTRIQEKMTTIGRWVSVAIVAFAFLITGVFFLIKDAGFIKSSPSLNRIASISLDDTKTQARAYIWPMALKGFTERPILGWGQENFNYLFNANYNPKMWNQEQWFDRAHSVYLDWLVASGGVGLLVYLALYFFGILAIWKSSLSTTEKSIFTGLIIAYGIHNIFVFDNLASYISFFAIIAFFGSIVARSSFVQNKEPRSFSLDAVEYIVMPISIVALLACFYFLNVRPIQANTRLIKALSACGNQNQIADAALFTKALNISAMANQEIREQSLSCASSVISRQYPGPTKQAFYELAQQNIKDQISSAPNDARMYVLGGSFMNGLNQFTESIPLLEKAHELSPNKQTVSMQLASAYLNVGKFDEAVQLFKQAYEADPSYEDAKQKYIIGLIATKNDTEARKLASTSMELLENDTIARVYGSTKQYDKAIALYKKLLEKDSGSLQYRVELAQVYALAGMKWQATDTLRSISKDHPEYKDQVEAMVKQVEEMKPQ